MDLGSSAPMAYPRYPMAWSRPDAPAIWSQLRNHGRSAVTGSVLAGLVSMPLAVAVGGGVGAMLLVLGFALLLVVPILVGVAQDFGTIKPYPKLLVDGVHVRGEAFALLKDIDHRFDYARDRIDAVPTAIDWDEVADDVETIRWACLQHAVALARDDEAMGDLRYATPGTPQAALRRKVEERQVGHRVALEGYRRDADELARLAGNAAAAARYALEHGASTSDLEVVMPSPAEQAARAGLERAKTRLALLADVWTSLDESAGLWSERIEGAREEGGPARPEAG